MESVDHVTVTLRLPREIHQKVRQRALQDGKSMQDIGLACFTSYAGKFSTETVLDPPRSASLDAVATVEVGESKPGKVGRPKRELAAGASTEALAEDEPIGDRRLGTDGSSLGVEPKAGGGSVPRDQPPAASPRREFQPDFKKEKKK